MDRYEFREFYDADITVTKSKDSTLALELKMPAIHGNEQIITKELEQTYKEFQVQVSSGVATIKGAMGLLAGKQSE